MTAPDWLPTARALAAVWTGPPLAQHVVSDIGTRRCDCGFGEGCRECDDFDPGTVPDLTSDANGGVLLVALWKVDNAAAPCIADDGSFVAILYDFNEDQTKAGRMARGAGLAEAAALAYLATR